MDSLASLSCRNFPFLPGYPGRVVPLLWSTGRPGLRPNSKGLVCQCPCTNNSILWKSVNSVFFFCALVSFTVLNIIMTTTKIQSTLMIFLSRQFQMFSNIYSKILHNEEKKHFFKVVERALLNRLL